MKGIKKIIAVSLLTVSTMTMATLSGTMDALNKGDIEGALNQFFNKGTLTELTAQKTPVLKKKAESKGTDFSASKVAPKKESVNKSELNIQEMEDFFKNTFDSIGSMLNQK